MEEESFEEPILELERRIEALSGLDDAGTVRQRERLQAELHELRGRVFSELTPWQKTLVARHPRRPYTLDYVRHLFEGFVEIHGDRKYADDPAIVTGFGIFRGRPVLVVGHQKGRDTKEKIYRNFGMPRPEGYRKALRAMRLAEKFGRPILTFIDTPGAYPGIGAEERGQAEAIAFNLREMARLRVPILVTVTGEGGSGGALALGVGDRVNMLEFAVYSVISPEGCAAILWRDRVPDEGCRPRDEAHGARSPRARRRGRDRSRGRRRRARRSGAAGGALGGGAAIGSSRSSRPRTRRHLSPSATIASAGWEEFERPSSSGRLGVAPP